jgi:hypothetical protein
MTVACMRWGCWPARIEAGVLHRDGRTPRPTERRETRTVASCSFAIHGPLQLASSHLVRAEASVSCSRRGRSAVARRHARAEPRAKQHRRVCWLGAGPRRDAWWAFLHSSWRLSLSRRALLSTCTAWVLTQWVCSNRPRAGEAATRGKQPANPAVEGAEESLSSLPDYKPTVRAPPKRC